MFLQWIPWLLRMSRPGETLTRKTIMMQTKMKKLDLKENHSKSLLANVLEMEDDYQPITQFLRFAKIKDSASFFRLVFRAEVTFFLSNFKFDISGRRPPLRQHSNILLFLGSIENSSIYWRRSKLSAIKYEMMTRRLLLKMTGSSLLWCLTGCV